MNILNNLRTSLWAVFFTSFCLFSSCADETGQIGLDLQNPESFVFVYNDSSTVLNTYTVQKEDLISLDIQNLASSMLLGYQIDEKLGTFQNNFMSEVEIPGNSTSFGTNPIADSLVLYLSYTTTYGDPNQIQTVTVYELNHEDTLYTINKKPMDESVISQYYNPSPITTFSFKPSNDNVLKTIRITFPEEYKNKFMDTASYATDSLFRANVLNGFYFVANPITSGGAISYFSFGDSTRMQLYYHFTDSVANIDTTLPDRDTIIYRKYTYQMNSSTHRCNIFKRNYNPQIKYLPNKTESDISYEQELFYTKNNNAFEGRIDITGLQTWKDSGDFTFNKAILTLYVEPNKTDFDKLYPQHSGIEVWGTNENFEHLYLEEYIGSKGYLTSTLDTTLHRYQITINRTLFNAIKEGKDVLSLVLTTSQGANIATANRTIFKGAKNLDQPLKLKITYTKFKAE